MKFEIGRRGIRIIPENEQDIAYIEDTLGLKHENNYIDLSRINIMGFHDLAYLETGHRQADKDIREAKQFLEKALKT